MDTEDEQYIIWKQLKTKAKTKHFLPTSDILEVKLRTGRQGKCVGAAKELVNATESKIVEPQNYFLVGLGEVQLLNVLLSGMKAYETSLVMAYRIFRGEKAYGCSIGLLFEQSRVNIDYGGAAAYQHTVLEIPGRVAAVKLRHDAHLSVSSYLFGMPGGSLKGRNS
ncbi:hypothetical protein EVAR_70666_1 [Eumeta japonica]|uniref:Uncharacterized protein n=1 Tax=Eumeta variegata TaxID=151549 RepID=A0A4C2ABN3_EUMVA|nr:hypothetical protein EVAR_70666_1 [Eumeta japonica]